MGPGSGGVGSGDTVQTDGEERVLGPPAPMGEETGRGTTRTVSLEHGRGILPPVPGPTVYGCRGTVLDGGDEGVASVDGEDTDGELFVTDAGCQHVDRQ